MFALNRLLPIVGVVFLSFLYSQSAQAEICWEPQVVDGPVLDGPVADGSAPKEKKNKKGGKGVKRASGDVTIQHNCGYPTPTPPTPSRPGTPNVSVTNSSSGSYTVSWSASSSMDSYGLGQWGYELLEYRNGSYVKQYKTSPTTTSQSISNNSDGNYQYKVRGCNMNLNTGLRVCSNYSSLSSTNYVRHKPSKPSTPSIGSSTSTGSVTVSWSKPSGSVSFYRIQKRKNGGSWTWADTNHASTSKTISGLTDGSWDFRVQACNTYTWACSGLGTDSSNTTVRLRPSTPSAPGITDTTRANGHISVTWSKPSGSVSMYDVLEYKSGVSGYTVVANDSSATSLSLTGRTSGNYTYRVRACNGYNWACSSYSGHSTAGYVRIPPSKPATPTVSSTNSTGSVTINWTKPSGIVSFYRIQKRANGGSWVWADGYHTPTSLTVSGLTEGSWDFRVQACNQYSWACSSYSNDSANVTVNIPPSTPSAPSINDTTVNGSVTASWTKPSGTVTFYRLQKRKNGGSWTWADTNHASTSKAVSGLSDGSWDFRVQACNSYSWSCSGFSTGSANTTVRVKPSAPSSPSISTTTSTGNVTVSWSKPSGSVSFYRIQKRKNSGSWTWADSSHASTSKALSGLTDGSWDFRVQACNSYSWACSGLGADSANTTVRVKPSTPSSPNISTTTSTGNVTVSWSKPSGNVSFYRLQKRKNGGSWTWADTNHASTSKAVSGLSDGGWDFRVQACNSYSWSCSGLSSDSTNTTVRIKPSAPAAPSLNDTTVTNSSVTVSWAKPSGTVTYYQVQKRLNSGSWTTAISNTSQMSYTGLNLSDGSWTFRVIACNQYSWACSSAGSVSAAAILRKLPTTPSAPTVPSSTSIDGAISVGWTKPSGTVTKYDVIEYKSGVSGYSTVANNTPSTSLNLTGRADGSYTYRVRACNGYDWSCSSYSAHSSATGVLHKPGTPSSISAPISLNTNGSFSLSWGNSSGQVDYYQTAHRQKPKGGSFNSWTYINRGDVNSVNYSGLSDGEWDFAVRGCNDSGCSGWRYISPHVQVLHKPGTPPSISGPTLTDVDGSHVISWGASSGFVESYELRQRHKAIGSSTFGGWATEHDSPSRSKSFTLLANGEYDYAVRACNEAGCSGFKYIAPHVTVLKPPYSPTGVSVDSSSDDGIYTLNWNSGGGIVDDYRYAESPSYDSWISAGTALSKVISGKSDGSWSYKVKACNTSGCSANSLSNTVTVTHPTPAAPASMSVPASVAETSYTVSWDAVTSPELDFYQISQQHESNGWSGWTKTSGTSAQITVDEAGDWTHRVRACNELPDMTKKCSSARTSSVVDVQLPPDWGLTGGSVADKASVPTNTLSGDSGVGAIQGKAGVSGGAAVYNIPIAVPPGRKGMQPKISLSYSSRGGNGIAGKGWSLNAGGSIHRCALLWELDNDSRNINLTTQDKLCLNGTRLILDSGTYGQNNAIYRPETSPATRVTQVDGAINGAGTYFKVEGGSGSLSYYGNSSNSRLSRSGTTVTSRWLLAKTEDASLKNNIKYQYSSSGDIGSLYLDRILYTGYNDGDGNRVVDFVYEDRDDPRESYLLGTYSQSTQKLSQIKTSVSGSSAYEYTLMYRSSNDGVGVSFQTLNSSGQPQYSSSIGNDGNTSHCKRPNSVSLLTGIQQCSWNSGVKECLGNTDFTMQSFDPELSTASTLQSFSDASHIPSIDDIGYGSELNNSFDLDGDGSPDLGYSPNNNVFNYSHVWLSSKRVAYSVPSNFHALGNNTGPAQRNLTLDINADGARDLVGKKLVSGNTYLSVLHWDESSNSFQTTDFTNIDAECVSQYYYDNPLAEPGEVAFNQYSRSCRSYVLDANGDGLDDLILATRPQSATTTFQGVTLDLYLGCANGLCSTSATFSIKADSPARNVDLDGDGKQELVFTRGSLAGEIGNGFEEVIYRPVINANGNWNFTEIETGFVGDKREVYHYQDINGDGLQDVLRQNSINGVWTLRINNGSSYGPVKTISSLPNTEREHEKQGQYQTSPVYLGGNIQFFDYDQDGLLDVVAPTNLKHEAICTSQYPANCRRQERFNNTFGSPYIYDFYDLYEWSIYKANLASDGTVSYELVTSDNISIVAPLLDLQLIDYNSDGALDIITRLGYDGEHYEMGGSYAAAIYAFRNPNSRVDYITNIKDGLDIEEEFGYQALHQPSDFNKSESQRFYSVDLSGNANDFPYSYFGTASQMVSIHNTDNGVGGTNSSTLQYRNARYHHQGRGFQGFGEIIETKPQLGVKSSTLYEQSYPLSGKVKHSYQYAKDASNNYKLVSKKIANNSYLTNDNVYTVYTSDSHSYSYDLSTGSELTHKVTQVNNIDEWGNVKSVTESHSDAFGTVSQSMVNTYAPQTTSSLWWPNKKTKAVVTSNPVTNRASGAPIAPGTDTTKSVTTDYLSFNPTYRVPTSVKTSGSDTTLTTTVSTTLTGFGLPDTVSTVVTGLDNSTRTVSTGYTAGISPGYFVNSITNDLGHETTTVTDTKTGKPKSITDPNNITTMIEYDAFAREKSRSMPNSQDVNTAYYWCNSNCPQYGSYYRKTVQSGSPTSIEYFDKLGRTLGADTSGFDGSMIATRVTYNSKGQKSFESIPYSVIGGDSTLGTYYVSYDSLGRLTQKKVNQPMSDMTINYGHNGLKTTIDVSAPGVMSLSMERAYNGLKQLVYTKDAKGGYTRYSYDGMGNPISLEDAKGATIDAWYNSLGHKTQVDDPNMGVKTFVYNSVGEVEREQDANGHVLEYSYDDLGRIKERKVDSVVQASFVYDTRKKGLLSTETSDNTKHYYYNSVAQPTLIRNTIDGVNYDTRTAYDTNYGYVKSLEYPSGLTVGYSYNQRGYLTSQYNAAKPDYVYQSVTARDARLNITSAKLANDVLTQTQSFFEATGQMASIQVQKTQGAVDKHFISYLYDGYGNLDTQTVYYGTGGDTTEETYQYDVLHRLTSTQRVFSNGASNQTLNYDYDAVGNFTLKDDYATSYDYGVETKDAGGNAGPNAVRHVSKIDGTTVNFTYDNNGNMLTGDGKQLDYNAFNKPILISAGGIESEFFYGTDISRYKQVKTGGTDGTVTTTYVDKLYEKVVTEKTGAPNTTEYKHYIGDVAIITKKETSGETFPEHTINYTLRDRLGSVVTLTNHQGDITEFRSYDPFGKPRTGEMQNLDPLQPATLSEIAQASSYFKQTNRGFTDHEHLDDAELIHMNGRAYDYNLGRFLSVDPFIQEPGNSQSMNPYSYIMNNPLAGTDPSGYVANWGTKSGDSSDGEEEPPPEEPPEGCQTNWCAKVTYDDGSVEYVVLGNGSNTSNSSSTDDVSLAPSKTSNNSVRNRSPELMTNGIKSCQAKDGCGGFIYAEQSPYGGRVTTYIQVAGAAKSPEEIMAIINDFNDGKEYVSAYTARGGEKLSKALGWVSGAGLINTASSTIRVAATNNAANSSSLSPKLVSKLKGVFNKVFGRGNPVKPNNGGRMQPYNAKTGLYLPYAANPGFTYSAPTRFSAGFGNGYLSAKSGVVSAPPIGRAGELGYALGNLVGNIF